MPEYIGGILIPEPTKAGTFPLTWEFGSIEVLEPEVIIHRLGSAETLIEQRFYRGPNARIFRLNFSLLSVDERELLLDFFVSHLGSYHPFTLNVTERNGSVTEYTARFREPVLSIDHAHDWAFSSSIELHVYPTDPEPYTINSTDTRFPGVTLTAALLSQVQEIIPLLKVDSDIYLSDRRCTVGGVLYQPRLLSWSGIQQSISGAADEASFTLGNADRVFRDLSYARELRGKWVTFSLFHVGTGIKLDLWTGEVRTFIGQSHTEFTLQCWDIAADPRHAYPTRVISRQDGFDPGDQPVNVGGKKGISPITSTSIINDTAYGKTLRDCYVNSTAKPLAVACDIIAGRDEDEYYAALGVIGRGPINSFYSGADKPHTLDNQSHHGPGSMGLRRAWGGTPSNGDEGAQNYAPDNGSNSFALSETGKPFPTNPINGCAFLEIRRNDPKGIQPARTESHTMTAMLSGGLGCWVWTEPGTRVWQQSCTNPIWIAVNTWLRYWGLQWATYITQETMFDCAAAVAAATYCDTKVKVLIGCSTGVMNVSGGVCSWVSGDYFDFSCVDKYIWAKGAYYLVTAFTGNTNPALATITVSGIPDGSTDYEVHEERFRFAGIVGTERRPVRDWLREILACCCGNFSFVSGKLRILIRQDSGVDEAFTIGNIIHDSLKPEAVDADFNDYTLAFSDIDYGYQQNSVNLKDADDISARGQRTAHRNLLASCGKSQAVRICATEFRESIGGITTTEKRHHRLIRFRTTILALATEVGMVCSVTHADVPGGLSEFRVHSWSVNSDFSLDIEGRTTYDSMYDLLQGEIPVDVQPDTVPVRPVYDTRPGDVTNFQVSASTDDGLTCVLTCTYTPPDPVGSFVGISPIVEIPNGSEKYYPQGNHDDDTLHTVFLRIPLPMAAQTWRVFAPSRSRVAVNPLDPLNTPQDTVFVDPASIGESRSNTNNIAYDPGFDQGYTFWEYYTEGDSGWAEATDQYRSPDKSQAYIGTPGMAGKNAGLSQHMTGRIDALIGKQYIASLWIRRNSAANGTFTLYIIGATVVGGVSGVIAWSAFSVDSIPADTWTKVQCSAYLADTTTRYVYLQINCLSVTAGKIWIDDAELRELEPNVPAPVGSASATFTVDGATTNSILSETGQELFRLNVSGISLPSDLNLITFRIEFDRSDDTNPDYTDYTGPLDLTVTSHKSDPWQKTTASFTIQVRIVGVNRDNIETVMWTSSPVTVAPSGNKNIPGSKIADGTIAWTAAATAAGMTNVVNQAPDGNGQLSIAKTSEVVWNSYDNKPYRWDPSISKYRRKAQAGDFENYCIDSQYILAATVVSNAALIGNITTNKLLAGLLSGFTLYLEQNGVVSQFYSTYDAGMGAYIGWSTHRQSDGLAMKASFGGLWIVSPSYPSTPMLWLGYPTLSYPTLGWQLPSWGSVIGIGNPVGAMYLTLISYGGYVYGLSTCKSQQFVDSTGKRLIAGRVTGWAPKTGSAVRDEAWDTESCTLAQVARAFKALIDDLYGSDTETTYPVKKICLLSSS